MFEPNKQQQDAINKLYNKLKDEPYGARFSWDELKDLSGLDDVDKGVVYYIANKVCLMLMVTDQKYLATEFKYGKRIVNPNEHELIAKKTASKSVKIYKKAGAVLASTNMDELSEDEKRTVVDAANKYSTLEMFTNEMLKKKKIGEVGKDDLKTAGLFLDAIKMFAKK